jgi:predicted RNA binding protein YcfA (HicA-like mRNA interferase family)
VFCQLLEAKGWKLKRINGSHHIYHIYAKLGITARISAPVHGNKPLKPGLQKHLMKLGEIDENYCPSRPLDFKLINNYNILSLNNIVDL